MCCKTKESGKGCYCSGGNLIMSKKKKIQLANERIDMLKAEIEELEEYIEEIKK